MHIHDLSGCVPTPLAHYLKALGILRLVAEQADPGVRGWWIGERFRLASTLDRDELEKFFLQRYQPTALVSPWNKGSGFYGSDPEHILKPFIDSKAERFSALREGIAASLKMLNEIGSADVQVRQIKGETKDRRLSPAQKNALKESDEYKQRLAEAERRFKALKSDLIPDCRLSWRGSHRHWIDAALVLDDDGKASYPALLGTGGNDGRLDFTNNYMQRLTEVFDLAETDARPNSDAPGWLRAAIWGDTVTGYQNNKAVGQFLPGFAGGANNSNGPDAESLLNPFDFIFMMEGALLFSANATRRLGLSETTRAAAPFVFNAVGAGYASASEADEGARGEQWMPLWNQPMTAPELRRLMAEGRAQIGARPAREPLDMARAVARFGTARGISAFQRYAYIERNGQSNLAVPIGRFDVPEKSAPLLACLDDLDVWLRRLRSEARGDRAPIRLKQAERRVSDALFAVVRNPDEGLRWQELLLAMTGVEAIQVTGSGHAAGPIPKLRPDWVKAASQSPDPIELRLAVAFASQKWRSNRFAGSKPLEPDTVRRHWLPLTNNRYKVNAEQRLMLGPEQVMQGRRGEDDAIALVVRRLIEAEQAAERRLPLVGRKGLTASISDLARLTSGTVDLDRTVALARALMAVEASHVEMPTANISRPEKSDWPDDAWIALRLALFPESLSDDRLAVPADPAIVRRLMSGDAVKATEIACQRLQAAGIRATTIRFACAGGETARLWAAALAFPISRASALAFLNQRLAPKPQGLRS